MMKYEQDQEGNNFFSSNNSKSANRETRNTTHHQCPTASPSRWSAPSPGASAPGQLKTDILWIFSTASLWHLRRFQVPISFIKSFSGWLPSFENPPSELVRIFPGLQEVLDLIWRTAHDSVRPDRLPQEVSAVQGRGPDRRPLAPTSTEQQEETHCSHIGPHLGTLVPMGTKMSFLVPIWSQFIFKVPIFSISDLRTRQKSVQPLSNVNHEITCGNKN